MKIRRSHWLLDGTAYSTVAMSAPTVTVTDVYYVPPTQRTPVTSRHCGRLGSRDYSTTHARAQAQADRVNE